MIELRFCEDGDVGRDVSLEMSVTQALMLAGTPASFPARWLVDERRIL